MSHNFGFAPPIVSQNVVPVKKALPEQLIPADSIHTGDGWVFSKLGDGSVQIRVVSPADGRPVVATVLTGSEFDQVLALVRPPAPDLSGPKEVGGSSPFSPAMTALVDAALASPAAREALGVPADFEVGQPIASPKSDNNA